MTATQIHPLTIYLIKEGISEGQILKSNLSSKRIPGVGKVYFKKTHDRIPSWCKLFGEQYFNDITTSSVSGAFIINKSGRHFVLVFGQGGRYLINQGVYEEKFGFKTTINTVKEDSLRSLDIVDLDSVGLQKRVQSVKPDLSESFGFDIEKDLIRSITGVTDDESRFGKILTGKDSLSVRLKTDISQLGNYLGLFLEKYHSEDYKSKFPRIDNISEVITSKKEELNQALIENLSVAGAEIYLTIPDIIDRTNFGFFSFTTNNNSQLFEDLKLQNFIDHMTEKNKDITIDQIKKEKIYYIKHGEEIPQDSWNLYNCLHTELNRDNYTYILSGGKRYEIHNDLVMKVNDYYSSKIDKTINGSLISIPAYITSHTDEKAYNIDFALANNGVCLDGQFIQIEGHSKFEFCDILTEDKRLIHVKRYYGSSSLSHLFNQAYVSAKLFLDQNIRTKINTELLTESYGIADINDDPRVMGYTITMGIIKENPENFHIPFFSKLTLMNIHKELTYMNYNVTLLFINDEKKSHTTGIVKKKQKQTTTEE